MADKSKKSKQHVPEITDEQLDNVAGGKTYRPAPSNDGTTEQFFTIEIVEGRIAKQPGEDLTTASPEE